MRRGLRLSKFCNHGCGCWISFPNPAYISPPVLHLYNLMYITARIGIFFRANRVEVWCAGLFVLLGCTFLVPPVESYFVLERSLLPARARAGKRPCAVPRFPRHHMSIWKVRMSASLLAVTRADFLPLMPTGRFWMKSSGSRNSFLTCNRGLMRTARRAGSS